MANKALLIGIDRYPEKPLQGAVNDVLRMKALLDKLFPSLPFEVSVRPNDACTRAGILERLGWLVDGVRPGDRLLFHFSGHGMQVRTADPSVESDGLDEVICPYDIDLQTGANAIRDKELNHIFAAVPAGVSAVWFSDSCHSAHLTRSVPENRITRSLPSPPGTANGPLVGGLARSVRDLHVAMISACASSASAEEGSFGAFHSGALTQALIEVLGRPGGAALSLSKVVVEARAALDKHKYVQVPQIEGDSAITSKPLWVL